MVWFSILLLKLRGSHQRRLRDALSCCEAKPSLASNESNAPDMPDELTPRGRGVRLTERS